MTALTDQPIRDRAVSETGRSMALAAGAGSGKTTVLVQRLLNVLRAGARPAEVAAITFTVKAAGELVERVRDRLETDLATATGGERAALQRILDELPELTISTIHSFCGELLRREALEAGWAPSTQVLGEMNGPSSVESAFRVWRRGFDARHPEAAVALVREAKVAPKTLRAAIMTLLEHRDLRAIPGRSEPAWDEAVATLRPIRRALLDAAEECTNPGKCTQLAKQSALVAGLRALDLDGPAGAVVAAARALPIGDLRGGSGKNWRDGALPRFKDAIRALRETWLPSLDVLALEPLHGLLVTDATERFLPAVRDGKAEAAQVDFQDLLFQTLELLETRPDAARRLNARFSAILVDEVQDTDPIQSAIVARLTRDLEAEGDWDAHPPLPGGLFAVGDPQQSIYRFRRADVAIWRQLHRLVAGDDDPTLSRNFRSVAGVVAFVNHAFATYPDYRPLEAHREPAALDPVVSLVNDTGDEDAGPLARYVHHLVTSGAEVVDRDTGGARPARWGDVMVLLPSWTRAEAIQEALLELGVPCVVEGGRTFFGRDEVKLCVAALRAIEEPADAEATVIALRGLFGVSLRELAEHRAAGGSWRYTVADQPVGPARDALEVLAGLHRRRGEDGWVTLLDALLEETGAPAVWSLLPRGAAMLANVDKLRAIVRELEGHVRSGLELVEQLRALEREEDEDLPLAGADADVVRVTTYFKAKGLEAPIVALPYARRNQSPIAHAIDRERGEIRVRLGALRPPGWETAETAERDALAEERRRWMYVAATRARDQLVVVDHEKNTLLDADLRTALPDPAAVADGDLVPLASGVEVRARLASCLPSPPVDESTFPGRDDAVDQLLASERALEDPGPAWTAARRRAIGLAKRRSLRWRSVTELSASGRGARGRVPRGTARAGTVVHRVMERLDLTRPAAALEQQADALARRLATREELPPELVDECAQIVTRLLRHPVLERARAATEHYKEVPFAYPGATGIVSGTIDLAFPVDEARRRWVVVDWKSVLPPPGSPKRAQYEAQIAHYAQAIIETIVGVAPEDVETVLAGPPPELVEDPWELALDEADDAVQGLLRRLRDAEAPPPEVGLDVGAPVIATVELAWEDRRVAVTLAQDPTELDALRSAGWTVLDGEQGDTAAQLAAALGVAPSDQDDVV